MEGDWRRVFAGRPPFCATIQCCCTAVFPDGSIQSLLADPNGTPASGAWQERSPEYQSALSLFRRTVSPSLADSEKIFDTGKSPEILNRPILANPAEAMHP